MGHFALTMQKDNSENMSNHQSKADLELGKESVAHELIFVINSYVRDS